MDDTMLLFDVVESARVQSLEKMDILGQVTACEFTPSGERLLAGGYSGHIKIWTVGKEGQLKDAGQFAGHSKEINCIAVSGDSRFALSGSSEKKVRYWQIDTGKELAVFPGFEGRIKAVWISANGKSGLATDGATLLHLDLAKQTVAKTSKLTGSWAAGQSAAIAPSGEYIAVGDSYNIRLWELKTMKELPALEGNDIQWSAVFTPDGTRLVSGGNGKVNVWDVKRQQRIGAIECAKHTYIQSIAASPDNKHVAAIGKSAGQTLKVLRIQSVDK
jgi:WD40 repeat protein